MLQQINAPSPVFFLCESYQDDSDLDKTLVENGLVVKFSKKNHKPSLGELPYQFQDKIVISTCYHKVGKLRQPFISRNVCFKSFQSAAPVTK